jgi:hypothetical protein
MPAKLVVVAGAQPGREIWIEEEVLRIGSEAPCEVRLAEPGLSPHAVTLEFRDTGYHVYNRGDQPIRLDRRPIGPREPAAHWPAGKDLNLGGQLTLRLVIDGDPAPAKRQAVRVADDEPEVPTAEAAAPEVSAEDAAKKNKKTVQLAAILGLVVVAGAVLLYDPPASEDKPKVPASQRSAEIIQKLRSNKAGDPADNEHLRTMLQRARLAELRGDKPLARDQYRRLYDWLQDRSKAGQLSQDYKELWEFVKVELQQLRPEVSAFD